MERVFFIQYACLNNAVSCKLLRVGEPCLHGSLFMTKDPAGAGAWSRQVFAQPLQRGSVDRGGWAEQVIRTGHGSCLPCFLHLYTVCEPMPSQKPCHKDISGYIPLIFRTTQCLLVSVPLHLQMVWANNQVPALGFSCSTLSFQVPCW